MRKRILSIILSIVMLVSLLPTAAFAAGTDTGKAIQLVDSGTAANIGGGQADSIYFGTYKQSSDGNSGYNVDPIKWRVLSNADGKLFLLSDQNLDVFEYHKEKESVTWETSTMRSWLNGLAANQGNGDDAIDYTSNNFLDSAFSAKEQAAIADTTVVNDDNGSVDGGDDTTDKVFLLSIAEASNTSYFADANSRIATNTAYVAGGGEIGIFGMNSVGEADYWWLRSPGCHDYCAARVESGGLYSFGFVNEDKHAVRPAFNLNLNSVLFTSAAAGGKADTSVDGSLTEVGTDGTEWKLTLLDTNRSFSVSEQSLTGAPGGTVSISYSGAETGNNEYVSVMLAQGDTILYYGRIAQNSASGTAGVTIPSGLADGTYILKVFSEQYNGDQRTDYASAFEDISLTVSNNPTETHSHHNCGVANCTAEHDHSEVDSWTKLTASNLSYGTLSLTAGNSYYLGENITVTEEVAISGEVNLCLNGHSITSSASSTITVSEGATLNICDCSTGETGGKIANTSYSNGRGINNSGTVNVYGGTIEATGHMGRGIYNEGSGTINFSGGSVSGKTYGIYNNGTGAVNISDGSVGGDNGIYNSGTGSVTVSGGTVTGSNGYGIQNGQGTVNITGGTVSGEDGIYNDNGGSVEVSGGSVSGEYAGICNINDSTVTVTGGTVTGSSGYGIQNEYSGTLELSGAPTITGTDADVCLSNALITITGALNYAEGNAISIEMSTPGIFTSDWTEKMGNNAENYSSYFTSADSTYTVQPDGNNELKLAEPPAHSHDNCGVENCEADHNHSTVNSWTAWDGTDDFPGGDVYLTDDVTLTETLTISSGTVNLCLNGNVLKYVGTGEESVIKVASNATLTICDCTNTTHTGYINSDGLWVAGTPSGEEAAVTLTGGIITGGTGYHFANSNYYRYGGGIFVDGGTLNLYGGNIAGNLCEYESDLNKNGGGGVYVTNGIFNMYDGTITGNCAMTKTNGGGGLYLDNSTFNMSGGKISQNKAHLASSNYRGYGGGIYVVGSNSQVNLSGTAEISGNSAYSAGGGISLVTGSITMSGNAAIDGNEAQNGGGVSLNRNSTFTINGGSISNNTATESSGAGGVEMTDGTVTMNAGSISNNTAAGTGGGVRVYDGTFTMAGGSISGNKTTGSAHGGGVYIYNNGSATFVMNAGEISGNTASGNGGGVYNDKNFQISGGEISNNIASVDGGGVYANKTIKLSGAPTINGNTVNENSNNVSVSTSVNITVVGELTNTTPIGVTVRSAGTGKFASPSSDVATLANGYADKFQSDNPAYAVAVEDTYLILAEASHSHDMSVACGGSTVTYTAWDGTDKDDETGGIQLTAGSWYLTNNVTLDETLIISSGTVNLCLNGYSITKESGTAIKVESGATLNICDCSEGKTGNISATSNNADITGIDNSGNVNIYGGTVKATRSGYSGSGTGIKNTGSVTVSGGEISSSTTGITNAGGTLTVSGGTVHGVNTGIGTNSSITISGSPNITGGCDINLYNGSIIIGGALTYAQENAISVKMSTPGTFTSGWTNNMGENADDYDSFFTAWSNSYTVQKNNNGELELAKTYTVTVTNDGNGTASASPASAAAGTEITLTATPNGGYRFKEWQVISGGVTVSDNKFTMPSANVEIKAVFEADAPGTYTVTYKPGAYGAESQTTDTKTQSVDLTLKGAIFTRTGYTQTGWATTDGGEKAYDLNGTYSTDAAVSLYPVWTANTYAVTLNTNGATIAADKNITRYTYGVGATLPTVEDMTKDSHRFDGWYESADFSGSPVTAISATATGDKTYYAKWTEVHDITGVVKDSERNGIVGVTVKLMQGNDQFGTTTTADGGQFSFTSVPLGSYNVVAEQTVSGGTKTKTELVIIEHQNAELTIFMPSQNVSSTLTVSEGSTPDVVVGGLDDEAVQNADNNDSTHVSIGMNIEAKEDVTSGGSGSSEEASQQTAIKQAALAQQLDKVEFLSITVTKTVTTNGNPDNGTELEQTQTVLELIIPYSLAGKYNIGIYRHHDGLAEAFAALGSQPDEQAKRDKTFWIDTGKELIHIYTNRFSNYAIAYSDAPVVTPTPDPAPSGGDYTPTYAITVEDAENGEVKANRSYAASGSTVTITVTPEDGYALDELTVTDSQGNKIELTDKGDGTFTFKMPSRKVTIEASFVDDGSFSVCPGDHTCPIWPYTDAETTAWYHDGVHYIIEKGLMTGYGNGIFKPNTDTSRAMIAVMLWRLEGSPVVNYLLDFEDVKAEAWYTEAIRWAKSEGIIGGYGNGCWGPDDAVTREQMVTILWRYAQYKGYDVSVGEDTNILSYDDAFDVAEYAIPAMQWACGSGMVQGMNDPDGEGMILAPESKGTRAQIATMIMRFCTEIVK